MSKSMQLFDAPPAYSHLPPAAPILDNVCCITLDGLDRVCLIGCSPQLVDPLRNTILVAWGEIQSESFIDDDIFEFKLRGSPWIAHGTDAVLSRRLLVGILRTMAEQGWSLAQASKTGKDSTEKDTLYFERDTPDPNVQLVAVTFNMGDRIRVFDMLHLVPHVKSAILAQWTPGIDFERSYHGAHEFKLNGFPWFARTKDEVVMFRLLCTQIVANMKAQGFKFYGAIQSTSSTVSDAWFFRSCGGSLQ
ncbi:hypothetical protein BGZ73_007749 [Actinomortierella ambigua]|nr:hypothetical protein BGZ73_007749 [Actinomortierella ambigua]